MTFKNTCPLPAPNTIRELTVAGCKFTVSILVEPADYDDEDPIPAQYFVDCIELNGIWFWADDIFDDGFLSAMEAALTAEFN